MANRKREVAPTAEKETPVKVVKFERMLLCSLTDDEKAKCAERAAHTLLEHDTLEEKRKESDALLKSQVKSKENELRTLSEKVRTGREMRLVSCETRFEYRVGAVFEVRTDTGEEISRRAMTDEERQVPLFQNYRHPELARDILEELESGGSTLESLVKRFADSKPVVVSECVNDLVASGAIVREDLGEKFAVRLP